MAEIKVTTNPQAETTTLEIEIVDNLQPGAYGLRLTSSNRAAEHHAGTGADLPRGDYGGVIVS